MNDLRRTLSVRALALTSLLILPVSAWAGTPVLLRDIADDPATFASSDLRQLTPFKNQVAFVTDVADRFDSLWVSDGTGLGTRTVFQGCFGNFCNGVLSILGTAGSHLFFYAQSDEENIWRLWSTDGTRAGTLPLTKGDLASPGVVLSGGQIALSDRFAYFLGCGDACGVWRSDGTPAGTVLWKPYDGPGELKDLMLAGDRLYSVASEFGSNSRLWAADTRTGDAAIVASWDGSLGAPTVLTAAAGKLFFFAPDTDETSVELWVSDGTAGGTRALTRFEASNPFQRTEWMKEIGGRVYFVANDVVHGFELWRSDGTPQGTVRVSDFGYFEALAELSSTALAQAGGKILFVARDGLTETRLWISDGRPESTAPFRNLCPQGGCDVQAASPLLVQIGGKVFFPGENGFWSTDGTRAGTRRFSGLLCTGCDFEVVFQALQGKLVFAAADAAHGIELWTSDGTAAGTRRLTDVPDLSPFARPLGPVVAAGRWIYFRGRDSHGVEPWVTDGQETRLVADLGRSAPGSDPRELTPVGDRLFFTACKGGQRAVWVSGGTPETTAQVPDTAGSCPSDFFAPTDLTAASGRLFFHRRAAQISQLWSTDGGAPVQISHLTSANDSIASHAAIEFQGRLLVPIRTAGQLALWQSSAAGDGLVKKVDLPDLSSIDQMWAVGGEVFLRGSASDVALWRTDGTQAGTRQLADETNPASDFLRLGSSVLFIAQSRDDDGFIVSGLWKTDGTAAGTVPVRVPLGVELPYKLVAFQGKVYFFVQDGDSIWSLWRSDGTAAGTVPVRQLAHDESQDSFSRFGLTVSAGKLFFAAADGVHGRELWTSDGTADGTRMVLDLNPGKAAGAPDLYFTLTAAGGKLYFAGNDGVHGVELWESDGTAAGTRLVQDLAPEAASSLPGDLTPAGDHLFFTADDLLSGREPWALPLSGPAGCRPSSTRLCLNGGRYQVEASWLTGDGSGNGTAVPLSTDTGSFWFFNAANVELVVKILDGRGVNGHVWVFYGALSNVEYMITVTDTATGLTRRYFNPQGTLASVGDTQGFGPLGANSANPVPPVARAAASPLPLVSGRTNRIAAVPCQASARRLCLNNNRFAVEVAWKDFDNRTGTGTAVPLTTDTGTFWFFNAANVELVVKVLDGRPVNGKFWLFFGALSNVEYTVTVTDTQTGAVRTYRNPSGRFASVADTTAF